MKSLKYIVLLLAACGKPSGEGKGAETAATTTVAPADSTAGPKAADPAAKDWRNGDAAWEAAAQDKCDKGEAHACYELAKHFFLDPKTREIRQRTQDLYIRACELRHAQSCSLAAVSLEAGSVDQDRTKGDIIKAADYSRQACDLKDMSGCMGLAGYYLQGDGVGHDLSKAWDLLVQACEGSEPSACHILVQRLADGTFKPRDNQTGEYFKKKCLDLIHSLALCDER